MEAIHKPLDLSYLFSRQTKNRHASQVKDFYKYFQIPGISNLAAGFPNAHYFPFRTLEAFVASPDEHSRSAHASQPSKASAQDNDRIRVPRETPKHTIDLMTTLQYGTSTGLPVLASFVNDFALDHQHPYIPYKGRAATILTCGSTDGFSKVAECFLNPWDPEHDDVSQREGLLVEEYAYMGAVQTARPKGVNIVSVKMDAQGMLADGEGGLEDVLSNWDLSKGNVPHLLYTVTVGQNPTGGVLSVPRRRAIYEICQRHDVIIVEDDPYWFLQYPSSPSFIPPPPSKHAPNSEFLASLTPSYLTLDTDGRVVRLDTFSKTVAPGCRLGWITAQPAVIERIRLITDGSTSQPSGFTQSMIAELLVGPESADKASSKKPSSGVSTSFQKGWGIEGWIRWLEGLRTLYERRMNLMCKVLAEGQVLTGVDESDPWAHVHNTTMYEFDFPAGGMFAWVRVQLQNHPYYEALGPARLGRALWGFLTTKPYLVLSVPGTIFVPGAKMSSLNDGDDDITDDEEEDDDNDEEEEEDEEDDEDEDENEENEATEEEKGEEQEEGKVMGFEEEEEREKDDAKGWDCLRLCFAAVEEGEVEGSARRFVEGCRAFWQLESVAETEALLDVGVGNSDEALTALTGPGNC